MACKEISETYKKAIETLNNNWENIIGKDNRVLNVQVGPKLVDGKDTGELAIRVYVPKKMPEASLKKTQVMPKDIDGIKVDVIELATNDFVLGPTRVSRLSPEEQLKRAGGVKCKEENNR